MQEHPVNFDELSGLEGLLYSQFVKLHGTRERANDVVNPRYQVVGDIMLPRNSLIHYQGNIPGELGPSNTAAFISNYDKRINIFFNVNYETPLGTTKIVPIQLTKLIKQYEGGHYLYTRARQYQTVIHKEGELLVNNLAIGKIPVQYRRQTVFTPFQRSYNELYTLMESVNEFSQYDIHQFVEFKLPRSFPSYKTLELKFEKYKRFFNSEGVIEKYEKEALKEFQAEESFWLLDLFGILIGFENKQYSLFNRLNDRARSQLELIFSYNGVCWIANLQTLINLIGYDDKPEDTSPRPIKFNYFKRFYLALISLVSPLSEEVVEDSYDQPEETTKEEMVGDRSEKGERGSGRESEEKPSMVPNTTPGGLADLYASSKGTTPAVSDTPGAKGEKTTEGTLPGDSESENDSVSTETTEKSPEEEWGADIDDSVFERASIEQATIVNSEEAYSPVSTINRILERKAARGQLTTKEKEYYTNASVSYLDIEFGGRLLAEIVDIKPEDLVMKPKAFASKSEAVTDESVLRSRSMELTKGYVEQFLERDIMGAVLAVQNGGTALLDLNRETIITADSKYDVYKMKLQPVDNGNQSTRQFRLPKVASDGSFTINGVKSYAQLVRMDLPVRKINPVKVAISSYYDKKLMIERSAYKVDDYNHWLKTNIIQKSYEDKSITVKLGSFKSELKEVCWYYSVLASRFKEITVGGLEFNFDTESILVKHPKWKKYCKGESWVIGDKHGVPVLIDNTGLVMIDGVEKGYIEEILRLPMAKAPVPTATANINGYKFPVVVVLAYWIGFSELVKRLKPTHRVVEPGTRPMLNANEYIVQFADERLILDRRDGLSTLIFSGLRKLDGLANFSKAQLDDPNVWFSLINDSRVKPSHFKEMDLIYDMFIDPITARELERRGYPLIMDKLIIRAVEMLLNNEAEHEVEIAEQRLVGFERFPGHVYRELVKSTRQFRNKPNTGKKTFDLNPEAIMMNILTDSSMQPVEEVNPVHQLKQQEEVTFGGTFGRSDQAMVRRTRGQLPSYAGIISEAGKDSGKVGFISYLTSDAKIVDYAGNVDVTQETTNAGRGSVTANLLYGTTRDDSKRSLFSGVQLSQWMATDSYVANPIRTPSDSVVAYRNSELYCSYAKEVGVITAITADGMTVKYGNGNEEKFPLGYEVGKGAGEYHKHLKITDMKVGDKVDKGDVLAWDDCFYTRDLTNPKRIVIKLGTMARIALVEDQFTFEDSIGITQKYADLNTTPYLKNNEFKIGYEQAIKLYVKVGDKVEYDQVLADVMDPSSAMFEEEGGARMAGLDRLGIKQIKAKQAGIITKIDVIYNGDLDTAEESLKAFIQEQDKLRAKKAKFRELAADNGNVGGNTSVGKSKVYPNTASVTITIESKLTTTTADKFVAGNQMKGTVGFIYPDPIYTVDGREVDVKFSLKSLLNRMVLSLRDKLVANELNHVYTSRMMKKYGRYE